MRTEAESYFRTPVDPTQRRYEVLRAYFHDGRSAEEVAGCFSFAVNGVYSLARNFVKLLGTGDPSRSFFVVQRRGPKAKDTTGEIDKLIVELRKKYLSVPDIKAILDSLKYDVSEKYVFNVVSKAGFSLPRRFPLMS